ncbi:MAG: hypothetical protein LBH79_00335 [Nitrososphaerota archaeon]|jgi:hypothetical protein|nr:hypothetical protein [Nitrososphaerota archaeon]
MKKIFSAFLFALLVCELVFAGIACVGMVQATSKPAVPEFTVKYVNHPIQWEPATTINPYTGETTITNPGGTSDHWVIELTVKNQKFTSTKDSSGNWTQLFYNIGYKGRFEEEWQTHPGSPSSGYVSASKSDTTAIELPSWFLSQVPNGGLIDVKVQALIGTQYSQEINMPWTTNWHTFQGEIGDWSNIQTITINHDAINPTQPSSTSHDPIFQTPETPAGEVDNQLDGGVFGLDRRVVGIVFFMGVVVFFCVLMYKQNTRLHKKNIHTYMRYSR